MKRVFVLGFAVCCCMASADAAIIRLQNSVDGSGKLDLNGVTGELGYMDLVIDTNPADTINVSFVNAFLDTAGDCDVLVYDFIEGQPGWTYDRSAIDLPASLSGGNEYGLVAGSQDGSAALPLGDAVHIIDTLCLGTADTEGGLDVFFELGARQPQVFGPPPTYSPFVVAPPNFPPGFPNFLYIGDANSKNTPFEINCIPEPSVMAVLALAGLAAMRRR